jgi:hypothetical protein
MSNRYDVSSLQEYKACALRFYYDKIANIPEQNQYIEEVMGTSFHETLAAVYDSPARCAATEDDMVAFFNTRWGVNYRPSDTIINNSFQTAEQYRARGEKFVRSFFSKMGHDPYYPAVPDAGHIGVEYPMNTFVDDFEMFGTLDVFRFDPTLPENQGPTPTRLQIQDYKTYAKAKTLDHYVKDLQLPLYAYFAYIHFPAVTAVDILWQEYDQTTQEATPATAVYHSKDEVMNVIWPGVVSIAREIETLRNQPLKDGQNRIDLFPAVTGKATCRYCQYNTFCKAYNAQTYEPKKLNINDIANYKTCRYRIAKNNKAPDDDALQGTVKEITDSNRILINVDGGSQHLFRLAGVNIPSKYGINNNLSDSDGTVVNAAATIDNPALGDAAFTYMTGLLKAGDRVTIYAFSSIGTEDQLSDTRDFSVYIDADKTESFYAYLERNGQDIGTKVLTDGYGSVSIANSADKFNLYKQAVGYAADAQKGLWSKQYVSYMLDYNPVEAGTIQPKEAPQATVYKIQPKSDEFMKSITELALKINRGTLIQGADFLIRKDDSVSNPTFEYNLDFIRYSLATGYANGQKLTVYFPDVAGLEKKVGYTPQYASIYFQTTYWYAAKEYLENMKGLSINDGSFVIIDRDGNAVRSVDFGDDTPVTDVSGNPTYDESDQPISYTMIPLATFNRMQSFQNNLITALLKGDPNVGDHCAYCPLIHDCPANRDAVAQTDSERYRKRKDSLADGFAKVTGDEEYIPEDERLVRFLEILFNTSLKGRRPSKFKNELLMETYQEYQSELLSDLQDRRKMINDLVQNTDLQIGAVHSRATVTKVQMRDMKEYILADTLRQTNPMVARKEGSNHNADITIIFTGEDQINFELRHIIAQIRCFPYIQIRNAMLARTMIPMETHLDFYYYSDPALVRSFFTQVDMDRITQEGSRVSVLAAIAKSTDRSLIAEKMYKKARFMYAIRSMAITPMAGKVDTIALSLNVQVMDLEPITESGNARFLYDTMSAAEQVSWLSHYQLAKSWKENMVPADDQGYGDNIGQSLDNSLGYFNNILEGTSDMTLDVPSNIGSDYPILSNIDRAAAFILKGHAADIGLSSTQTTNGKPLDTFDLIFVFNNLYDGNISMDVIAVCSTIANCVYPLKSVQPLQLIPMFDNNALIGLSTAKQHLDALSDQQAYYVKNYPKYLTEERRAYYIESSLLPIAKGLDYRFSQAKSQIFGASTIAPVQGVPGNLSYSLPHILSHIMLKPASEAETEKNIISYIKNNINSLEQMEVGYIDPKMGLFMLLGTDYAVPYSADYMFNSVAFMGLDNVKVTYVPDSKNVPLEQGYKLFSTAIFKTWANFPVIESDDTWERYQERVNAISTNALPALNGFRSFNYAREKLLDRLGNILAPTSDPASVGQGERWFDYYKGRAAEKQPQIQIGSTTSFVPVDIYPSDVTSQNLNNPVSRELTVDDMSLSLVWIKYYTSILAEHISLNTKVVEAVYKDYHVSDYFRDLIPKYLKITPYTTMTQKYVMLPYRGAEYYDTIAGKYDTNNPQSKVKRLKRSSDNDIRLVYPKFGNTDLFRGDRTKQEMIIVIKYIYDQIALALSEFIGTCIPSTGEKYESWCRNIYWPAVTFPVNRKPNARYLTDIIVPPNPGLATFPAPGNIATWLTPGQVAHWIVQNNLVYAIRDRINELDIGTGPNGIYSQQLLDIANKVKNGILDNLNELYKDDDFWDFKTNFVPTELILHAGLLLHKVSDYKWLSSLMEIKGSQDNLILKDMNNKFISQMYKTFLTDKHNKSYLDIISDIETNIFTNRSKGDDNPTTDYVLIYNIIFDQAVKLIHDHVLLDQFKEAKQRWMAFKSDPTSNEAKEAMSDIATIVSQVSSVPVYMYQSFIDLVRQIYLMLRTHKVQDYQTMIDGYLQPANISDKGEWISRLTITDKDVFKLVGLPLEESSAIPNAMGQIKRISANLLVSGVKENTMMNIFDIRNEPTDFGSTTITSFGINITPNVVPVYMAGHENPLPQYLGGGRTSLQLEFVTTDLSVLENMVIAATELNVMMRYRSLTKAVSPFSSAVTHLRQNIPMYDKIIGRITAKLQSALVTDNLDSNTMQQMSISPVYIRNNITMMLGILAVGITDITIESIEEHPNTFNVMLNMIAVDPFQYEREIPKKVRDHQDDYSFMLQDMTRLPTIIWARNALTKNPALAVVANIESQHEKLAGLFLYMGLLCNLDESLAYMGARIGDISGQAVTETIRKAQKKAEATTTTVNTVMFVGGIMMFIGSFFGATELAAEIGVSAEVAGGAVAGTVAGAAAKKFLAGLVKNIVLDMGKAALVASAYGAFDDKIPDALKPTFLRNRKAKLTAAEFQKAMSKTSNQLQIHQFKKDDNALHILNAAYMPIINLIIIPFLTKLLAGMTYDQIVGDMTSILDLFVRSVEARIDNATGGAYEDMLRIAGNKYNFMFALADSEINGMNATLSTSIKDPSYTINKKNSTLDILNNVPLYRSVLEYGRVVYSEPDMLISYLYSMSHSLHNELHNVLLGLVNTFVFYSYSGFINGYARFHKQVHDKDILNTLQKYNVPVDTDIDKRNIATIQNEMKDVLKTFMKIHDGMLKAADDGAAMTSISERLKSAEDNVNTTANFDTNNAKDPLNFNANKAKNAHYLVDAMSQLIQMKLLQNAEIDRRKQFIVTQDDPVLYALENDPKMAEVDEQLYVILASYSYVNDYVYDTTAKDKKKQSAQAAKLDKAKADALKAYEVAEAKNNSTGKRKAQQDLKTIQAQMLANNESTVFDRMILTFDKSAVNDRDQMDIFNQYAKMDAVSSSAKTIGTGLSTLSIEAILSVTNMISTTSSMAGIVEKNPALQGFQISNFMMSLPRIMFTLYRLMDTYNAFYLMPIVSDASQMLVKDLKSDVFTDVLLDTSAFDDIRKNVLTKRGGDHSYSLLTPMTILYYSRKQMMNRSSLIDKYNCYPDFNLPMIINPRLLTVDKLKAVASGEWKDAVQLMISRLSDIALFTTPDFFIYRENIGLQQSMVSLMQNINQSLVMSRVAATETTSDPDRIKNIFNFNGDLPDDKALLKDASQMMSLDILKKDMQMKETVGLVANEILGNIPPKTTNADGSVEYDIQQIAKLQLWAKSADPSSPLNNNPLYDYIIQDPKTPNKVKLRVGIRASTTALNQWQTATDDLSKSLSENGQTFLVNHPDLLSRISGIRQSQMDLARKYAMSKRVDMLLNRNGGLTNNLTYQDRMLLDAIINPSGNAFNTQTFEMMYNKVMKMMYMRPRTLSANAMLSAIPTFKVYIIKEMDKELLFFNDFYEYNSVQSISVTRNRKSPVSTAQIVLSNQYGNLTNYMASRIQSQNPFAMNADEVEDVNALMLNVGAMIQVRMGYNSHLGPETIVFSGQIAEIQGDQQLTIVAQGWGAQLTRTIGTGPGKSFGGMFDLLKHTNKALGLVTELFEMAGPMQYIGTRSPFLGSLFANRQDPLAFSGPITNLKTLASFGLLESVSGLATQMVDTRLTNIYLRDIDVCQLGMIGRRRWLVHQDTLWDSLYDFTLQFTGKIMAVNPFDEEETLCIDDENGFYQYTLDNFHETQRIYPMMLLLKEAQDSAPHSAVMVNSLIQKEYDFTVAKVTSEGAITDDVIRSNMPILSLLYSNFISILDSFEKADPATEEQISNVISPTTILAYVVGARMDTDIKARLIQVFQYMQLMDGISADDDMDSLVAKISADPIKKAKVAGPGKNDDTQPAALMTYVLAKSYVLTCQILLARIVNGVQGFKPMTQTHMKTASKDIILNNITLESGFNRVEMSYMNDDALGILLGTVAMEQAAAVAGINVAAVDMIEKPSLRQVLTVSVSSTIRYNALRTYSTFQKNAAIRETFLIDTRYAVANGILANLVKDYYGGSLVITLDPTINPNDQIMIYDDVRDMWGMIGVKEVIHSIDRQMGAVTTITPDVYTKIRIDNTRFRYTGAAKTLRIMEAVASPIIFVISSIIGRSISRSIGTIISGFSSVFEKVTAKIGTHTLESAVTRAANATTKGDKNVLLKTLKQYALNAIRASKRDANATFENIVEEGGMMEKVWTDAEYRSSAETLITSLGNKVPADNKNALTDALVGYMKKHDGKLLLQPHVFLNPDRTINQTAIDQEADAMIARLKELDTIGTANGVTLNLDPQKGGESGLMYEKLTGQMMDKSVTQAAPDGTGKTFKIIIQSLSKMPDHYTGLGMGNIRNPLFNYAVTSLSDKLKRFALNSGFYLLKAAIYNVIGRKILMTVKPLADAFVVGVGEYIVGREPIYMSGLVHKGEPFIGNLEGIKKDRMLHNNWDSYATRVAANLFETPVQAITSMGDMLNKLTFDIGSFTGREDPNSP